MARGIDPAVAVFRIASLRQQLRAQQETAVVKADVRLSFDAGAEEVAELKAQARGHPRRSTLLEQLEADEPVAISWSMLPRPLPGAPPWLADPWITPCVCVDVDGGVSPAPGPADQCQW